MIGVESSLDWGAVIAAVIPSVVSLVSAVFALLIHRQIKTPSGDSIGHVVERAHETAIANNLLLSMSNGPTREATREELHEGAAGAPQIPDPPPDK